MNRETQIRSLVKKLRIWRNKGGGKTRRDITNQIRLITASWRAEQKRRLRAIDAIMDADRKRRCEELAKLIEADNRRGYEMAVAAIYGSAPETSHTGKR